MSKQAQHQHQRKVPVEARATGRNDQPLISIKWLLSALAVVIAVAAACAYATFCLLFYQGSWQLLFHPSREITTRPHVPYQEVSFDYTETGKAQLNGWWIPAETGTHYRDYTILFLHDGHGSLSDTTPELELLHSLGLNVFAFDYRGFGKSAAIHPSEASMNQDADASITYLTGTRHLPAHSLILYGTGLGAPVAASTAARHPEIAALVLENINLNALTLFSADPRTRFLPVRLLTSDRFDATETLKTLLTPKLFLDRDDGPRTRNAFTGTGAPKQFFQIAPDDQSHYRDAMQRFLDEALSHQ